MSYTNVEREEYITLIKKSEQLRIIKNFSKLTTTTIYDLKHLIEAMEEEAPANE